MMHKILSDHILPTLLMTAVGAGAAFAQSDSSQGFIPQDMAYVPYGSFTMGIDKESKAGASAPRSKQTAYDKRMSSPQSREAFHDEGPAHRVQLDAYLIDKYEVANKDFGQFIKSTGHPAPAYWDDPRLNKPDQPVVGINWQDAKAYCEWKGKRLPTEAEWERAARGPEGNLYPWGNEFDPKKANYGKVQEATVAVTSYPESASYYGLHHMAGNVFEWVSDWYDPSFYGKGTGKESVNPLGPEKAVWIGGTGTYADRLTVGEKRVIRGGSWVAPEGSLRTTHRFWNHPLNNSYGVGLGFRCAMTASSTIESMIKDAYIMALVSMGKENFQEADERVSRGLELDPTDERLRSLRTTLRKSHSDQTRP
jgi:gamma-glutamyl hercynylcysteine S-oxide synthase